jgi:ABC-type sugar transport system permease subunit
MIKQLQQRIASLPARPRLAARAGKGGLSPGDAGWIALFLLPFLVLYTGFTLWPLLATVIYSFFDWDGSKPLEQFVAMENYQRILADPIFWRAFGNTLVFSVGNTLIKLPLSLLAALVLTRKWLWFKNVFRTVYFVPIVIPVAMAGMIFTLLLNPANGALNDVLLGLGIVERPIDFLGRPGTAMLCLILVSVWQIFGQYMIYWMAALQNVPEELYEAAELDGAGEWAKLVFITLPIIRPVAIIIFFLALVNALKVFGLVVTMTGGGPSQATNVVSYFIYSQAFSEFPFRYGYASAAAVIFGLAVLATMGLQGLVVSRAQRARKDYGI